MTEMSPLRQASLQIAVLTALVNAAEAKLQDARENAAPLFAAALNGDGTTQVKPVLPGGKSGQLGTITIKAGEQTVAVDQPALLRWADLHQATAYRDWVSPSCLTRPDVIEYLAARFPELVERGRLRDDWRAAQVKYAVAHDGVVEDPDGNSMRIADVETGPAEGNIVYRPGGKAIAAVAEAWSGGLIPPEIDLGPLALPAPKPDPGEPVEGVVVPQASEPWHDGLSDYERNYIDGVVDDLGHGRCRDWVFDKDTRQVTCSCGDELVPANAGWPRTEAA
jgi:hypothetical protein